MHATPPFHFHLLIKIKCIVAIDPRFKIILISLIKVLIANRSFNLNCQRTCKFRASTIHQMYCYQMCFVTGLLTNVQAYQVLARLSKTFALSR